MKCKEERVGRLCTKCVSAISGVLPNIMISIKRADEFETNILLTALFVR
jgi:hypothetical protein